MIRKMLPGRILPVGALTVIFAISPLVADPVRAQLRPMAIPLATTLVVSKPAPGQIYGKQQVITIGVNAKTFRLVLKDAYVNDPAGIVHWPDIWQQVRRHRPNLQARGRDSEKFEQIKPGETFTIRGTYAPLHRTFEIVTIEVGAETIEPPGSY